MRPQSIVMFERLFLTSLVLSVIGFFIGYDAMVDALAAEPGVTQIGLGSGFVIGVFLAGLAIYLLLWFLIARKAANLAKWILVVLVGLSVLSLLSSLSVGLTFNTQTVLSFAVYALEVAAIVYLFRADAIGWLKGDRPVDSTTFE